MKSNMKTISSNKKQSKRTAKTLPIMKTESIVDELEQMHDRIKKRAYEIFEGSGQSFGKDLDDWLQAEADLVWKPSIELEEKDNKFLIQIAAPDIESKNVDIKVTPGAILVKAIPVSESASGNLFCSVHLSKKIDPGKVKAEFKDGMLHLTADIAEKTRARKIKPKASSSKR